MAGEDAKITGAKITGEGAGVAACPDCIKADHYDVRHEDGDFFAVCRTCGRRGPVASSLFEAVTAWRAFNGRPVRTMRGMVVAVALGLGIVALLVALLGFAVD